MASEVLASLAPQANRNPIATLNAAMTSKDPHVRLVAAEGLWKSTGQADQAIPILVDVLGAKELLARRWAARALGDAKLEYAPVVLPALRERLKDRDLQVRVFAAEAIWNIEERVTWQFLRSWGCSKTVTIQSARASERPMPLVGLALLR